MAIVIDTFNSAVNAAIDFFLKEDALGQNLKEKPLVRELESRKKLFPGGKANISKAVQGSWAATDANFFKGYTQDDEVGYAHPDNLLRASYPWKEIHAGINFTFTELKQDGITLEESVTGEKPSEHSDRDSVVLTDLLQNKLDDLAESWAIKFNNMLWDDGVADPLAVGGIRSLLTETPAVGTTGNLNRATYDWWRHIALIGAGKIAPSQADQTLSRKIRSTIRQLRKNGGKPDLMFAGSEFIDGLENEVQAKGSYTDSGFASNGKTEIGMADISVRGVGRVQYDPTLDDLGLAKRSYILSSGSIVLMPMTGEDKKMHAPARPYDHYVAMRALTWTGGLVCWQLNANGIIDIA